MTKAIILMNRLPENAAPDETDVLHQAEVFEQAFGQLGISHDRIFADLNLESLKHQLSALQPSLVVNLVESLGGDGSLLHLVPSLLESMRIPYTGNPAQSLFLTTSKPLSKSWMTASGIPTPAWFESPVAHNLNPAKTYIAKPSGEDASVGIDDDSVFRGDQAHRLDSLRERWGDRFFIEEFIAGREFNLSLLGGKGVVDVMKPAEILFKDYPRDKPAIVGYQAKWDESSFEYTHTVRQFIDKNEDPLLVAGMNEISLKCWHLFQLRGYARVDFRVDSAGNPWVLEINANPCIAPDSGFYAACLESGFEIKRVIQRIIEETS